MERRDAEITDLKRRVANSILIGVVSRVDAAKARYRVKSGALETDWIPCGRVRAGSTRSFESLSEGEQVVVVSASGDPCQGVIVCSLDTEETQAGDTASIHRTIYPDGTVVEYDHDAKRYAMNVAEGGSFDLFIAGGAAIEASGNALKFKAGSIDLESETLKHNGVDISSTHKHGGVLPGGGVSDVPVGG